MQLLSPTVSKYRLIKGTSSHLAPSDLPEILQVSFSAPLSSQLTGTHLYKKSTNGLLHTSKGGGNCLSGLQQIWEWNLTPKPQFSLDTT